MSSPTATRDATMQETVQREDVDFDTAADTANADTAEQQDDRSSSLSDPQDEQDDHEELEGVDEDTLLGEQLSAQRSLEVDSEAETERLDQTPQKLQKQADLLGRTPSKLSQAATAEEDLSEPPSPLPMGVEAASSTSTVGTLGQKRKRSDTAESSLTSAESLIGQSPRKRSQATKADEPLETGEATVDAELLDERAEDTPMPDEARATPRTATKPVKGRKAKHKGKKQKEHVGETEIEPMEEAATAEEEPAEKDTAKTEEELIQKKEASMIFEDVAKRFRALQDNIINERLSAVTMELQQLAQPECTHPEYLRQVACVDDRLRKQQSEAHAFYKYKSRSMRDRVLGERSLLHGQYFQHARELREDVLSKLGEDWYAIQKERRQSHQENDNAYVFKFPAKKSVQIKQQAKYNQEVSVLSGVAKYVGFPAAPNIEGAEGSTFEDDMEAMKISKRVAQPSSAAAAAAVATQQPLYIPKVPPPFVQNERLAHEQYLEQNAWARPQAPMHSLGAPVLSHTPDWIEPSAGHTAARNLIRNLSGRNPSPFATPVPQKRAHLEQSSSGTVVVNSDGLEAPSSVLAAPPTSDRIGLLHHHHGGGTNSNSQQTSPITLPKHRQNGAGTELTGFRNISNISGVSTIDAPQEPDHEQERHSTLLTKSFVPALSNQSSAPQQIFDASQLHRHGHGHGNGIERREVYANAGFRQEGAFGTPAPLGPAAP